MVQSKGIKCKYCDIMYTGSCNQEKTDCYFLYCLYCWRGENIDKNSKKCDAHFEALGQLPGLFF